MERIRNKQTGFSAVELLLTAVVVGVIAIGSVWIYMHHKNATKLSTKTNTASTNAATGATQQQAANLSTHQSPYGGFSFQYPAGWKVNEGQTGTEGEITISPVVSTSARPSNVFTMNLLINSSPSSGISQTRLARGTIQTFSNGISLWTSTEASATDTSAPAGLTVCPELLIVSADKTSFNFALPNGKYLTLEAGYCEGQGPTTSLTYQQQLAGSDWQSAVAIVKSIQFN